MTKKDSSSKKPAAGSKKAAMPAAAATRQTRKGGLGRGLASLIPTGPSRPGLGAGAADVILGGGSASADRGAQQPAGERGGARSSGTTGGQSNGIADAQRSAQSGAGTKGAKKTRSGSGSATDSRSRGTTPPASADSATKKAAAATAKSGVAGTEVGTSTKKRHSDDKGVGVDAAPQSADSSDFGATYQELPLDGIATNAKQPRTVFDEEALNELVHSIREFGLMQPIVVRPLSGADKPYELIMGERRLRAARRAGLDTIPAIVRETQDNEMLRDALLENIHRVQLNPLEEAAAYQQLLEEFGVTQGELAERLGRSRPLITNMIRLLQLPVSVQRRVGAGVLSAGHARALLGVKVGAEEQETLANRIVAEGLSVRATEEAVTLLNRGEDAKPERKNPREPRPLPTYVNDWASEFSDALDTKVSVQMGKKKGKIVVEFGGPEDFDRIIEILKHEGEYGDGII